MKARDADEKAAVALESLAENNQKELETMQTRLFDKAKAFTYPYRYNRTIKTAS